MPVTVKTLIASYREQMAVMGSKTLDDEEKQKALLKQLPVQMLNLFKLILGIVLFISPFILFILFDRYIFPVKAEVLYQVDGILVSCIAVILFIVFKKKHGAIFKGRKNPS
jgi:hypothetical protein